MGFADGLPLHCVCNWPVRGGGAILSERNGRTSRKRSGFKKKNNLKVIQKKHNLPYSEFNLIFKWKNRKLKKCQLSEETHKLLPETSNRGPVQPCLWRSASDRSLRSSAAVQSEWLTDGLRWLFQRGRGWGWQGGSGGFFLWMRKRNKKDLSEMIALFPVPHFEADTTK